MIKLIRCTGCNLAWPRRVLMQAVEAGSDLVCPTPSCARLYTSEAISRLLKNLGELDYAKPTQPPPPEVQ
jgi:hypothetical protein